LGLENNQKAGNLYTNTKGCLGLLAKVNRLWLSIYNPVRHGMRQEV
jgi:hypothetical protein